jgi:hypothetical protein
MSPKLVRRAAVCLVFLAGGCKGAINDPPGSAPPPGSSSPGAPGMVTPTSPPPLAAVPAGLRRLTVAQYGNTIHDLLGPSIQLPTEFDPDDSEAIFSSVGGYRITTSPAGVAKYEDAAYAVAHQVFADPAMTHAVVGCEITTADCPATFIKAFGRRAWRRPLTDAEVTRYTRLIADTAGLLGSPAAGFEHGLAGLLQSINFLYLPEIGEVVQGRLRFTSHEMASRLSYLLTDGPPDPELSAAADRNELVSPQGLQGQFQRLVTAPRAHPALVGFFGQLLDLGDLEGLAKDGDVYPQASPALFAAMRQEAERLIDQTTLVQRGTLFDLLDVKSAFVDANLARLYGLAAPASGAQLVPLPADGERGGILTSAAWLSVQAKPYSSSPTLRGVWLREKLLCQSVPPPPPAVNNVLPSPADRAAGAPRTTRQVLEDHRKNPDCAACHAVFDPLGVAFERFDGIGAYRTTENNLPIVTADSFDGKPFSTAAELVELLKRDSRVADCMVRHVYDFVTGHEHLPGEDLVVGQMSADFRAHPDFRDLLTRMVASDWFRSPGAPL